MTIAEVTALNPNLDAATLGGELDLLRHACKPFDQQAFAEGHMTPIFFGSALKNFGVGDLLDALAALAPPPRAQAADKRLVSATEPALSAFVFKIQANMDPNHRDRIAFVRLCSGKLTRGMKVKQVRSGKTISLHAPQFFFAQDRALAEEAYAGDVVGIPNHGTLRIGDTLTEGEELNFAGVPNFAPEILRRVRLSDAMRAKKLKQALQQLAEEGVAQVFLPADGSPALVGVVGPLQLDVLKARLAAEYGLDIGWDTPEFSFARWIAADDRKLLDQFVTSYHSAIAEDFDGDLVFLARNAFNLEYTGEHNPGISFTDVKDIHRRKPASVRPVRSAAGELLAQDFELEPLLLRRGDLQLQLAERGGGFFESGAVARIEMRIVELCLQRIHFGLQRGDGLRQRLERVLVLEHQAPLGGRRLGNDRRRFFGRFLRLLLRRLPRQIGAALRQHVAIAAGIFDPAAIALRHDHAAHQTVEKIAIVADEQHGPGIVGQHVLEHVQRFHIEIVGRLVEHQKV